MMGPHGFDDQEPGGPASWKYCESINGSRMKVLEPSASRSRIVAQCIDMERRREDPRDTSVTHRAMHRRGEEKRKRSRRVGRGRAASGGRGGQETRQARERSSTKTVSTTTEPHRSLVSSLRRSFLRPISVAISKRMGRLGGHQMYAHDS